MGGDGTGGVRSGAPEDGDGSDPVMEMVREQLRRDSPPSTHALYGRAVYLDPSLRRLSLRQFHARYPLQVQREMARRSSSGAGERGSRDESPEPRATPGRSPEGSEATARPGGRRKKLRRVFLDFARAMSRPEAAAGGAFIAARQLSSYVDRAVGILESGT